MNRILTGMRTFVSKGRRNKEPKAVAPVDQLSSLRSQYIAFCRRPSPIGQSSDEIVADFEKLIVIPQIQTIAFSKTVPLELLLGTTHVYLTDPKTNFLHDIGEFIIRIGSDKKVLMENITRTLTRVSESYSTSNLFHHPHILNGNLCIRAGSEKLKEYLAEGKISEAVHMLVEALWTIDEYPYTPVTTWNIVQEEDHESAGH